MPNKAFKPTFMKSHERSLTLALELMKITWLKAIAAIEILGGVSGPTWLFIQLYGIELSVIEVALSTVILSIYLLSAVAGVLLWRKSKLGWILSILVQLIQLPKIACSAIMYSMSFGLDIALLTQTTIGPSGYGIQLKVWIGAHHLLFIKNSNIPIDVGISLTSIVFLIVLMLQPIPANHEPQLGVQADRP